MKRSFHCTLKALLAATLLTGCSNNDQGTVKQADPGQPHSMSATRYCYQNEYPFNDASDQKDILTLTIDIDEGRAVGEYNWLPALKDKRTGKLAGSIDGRTVTATYKYSQEGQTGTAAISIVLESDEAVVEGGRPELGLNAAIARVDCQTR